MASDTEAPDGKPHLSSMGRFKITAEQREITALRERVAALDKANREAVELIDEINKRATSREFWGISQTIHAKLCTVRITLARALLANRGEANG